MSADIKNEGSPEDPLYNQGTENGQAKEVLPASDEAGEAEDAREETGQNGWDQDEYILPGQVGDELPFKASDERSAERSRQPSTSGSESRKFDEDDPVECRFCRCTLQEGKYPRVMYCGECGWSAAENWKLRRHAQSRHIYERAFFYCQCCEYRVEQMPVWPGESITDRPYECRECDYRARTSTALNYHLRAKHSDERPYKCPHCPYAGVQSSSLKSHMLTRHNTGEKNLLCPQCDFRANIPSVLKKHIERKHADVRMRRQRRQLFGDLLPQVVSSTRQESLPDASHVPIVEASHEPQNSSDVPQEQNDVADYLQMPSFGLFEAIYESQALAFAHQYGGKLRSSEQGSDVIVIDD